MKMLNSGTSYPFKTNRKLADVIAAIVQVSCEYTKPEYCQTLLSVLGMLFEHPEKEQELWWKAVPLIVTITNSVEDRECSALLMRIWNPEMNWE